MIRAALAQRAVACGAPMCRRAVVFAVLLLSVLAMRAEDQIFWTANDRLARNGQEWSAWPCEVYGLNSATEDLLNATVKTAWSVGGLHCAFDVAGKSVAGSSELALPSQLKIELLAEPPERRRERRRFEIRVSSVGTINRLTVDKQSDQDKATLVAGSEVAISRRADGVRVETFVPWSELGLNGVETGSRIGLRLRIARVDNGNEIVARSASDASAAGEKPDAIPTRLRSFILSDAEPPRLSVDAQEICLQGQPFVRIAAVAGERQPSQHYVVSGDASEAVDLPKVLPLSPSASGGLDVGVRYLALNPTVACPARLTFRLSDPSTGAARTLDVPIPVAHESSTVLARMRPIVVAAPAEQRDMVLLLQACALEAVAESVADGGADYDPAHVERRTDEIVAWAREVAAVPPNSPSFPFRAWRSERDGAVRPVRLIYPWNFDPAARYPARILIYGRNVGRGRLQFVEDDLRAWHSRQYYPYSGDHFTIVLFDASNDDEELEKTSLAYVFERLIPSLPIDPRRIGISGGSVGAHQAIDLAIRHPGRFAWAAGRAGSYQVPICFGAFTERAKFVSNLRDVPVFLTAGDAEDTSTGLFYDLLQTNAIPCRSEVVDHARHLFYPPPPPDDIVRHEAAAVSPHVVFKTLAPDYGGDGWIAINALETWGEMAEIDATLGGGRATVLTRNVAELRMRAGEIDPAMLPLTVVWNGREMAVVTERKDYVFSTPPEQGGGPPLRKRASQSGPAKRIEWHPITIVYGTKHTPTAYALQERAVEIVRQRVGLGDAQMRLGDYQIVADRDCTWADLKGRNVWVLGGPAENALWETLTEYAPVLSSVSNTCGKFDLLSFIFPKRDDNGRYVYLEVAANPIGYSLPILSVPSHDICAQRRMRDGTITGRALDFDAKWTLR